LRVGRTVFWDPLVAWRDKKLRREQATLEIARRYRKLVDLFDTANTRQAVSFDQVPSS
jgi:myo-inositol catabolism protein IolC